MDILDLISCKDRFLKVFGEDHPTPFENLEGAVAENRFFIQVLSGTVSAIRAEINGLLQKTRMIKQAEGTWLLAMRARDRAVFVNLAGETAILPAKLMEILSAGRSADVRVERSGKGVVLDDERGERTIVPFSFFINLPKLTRQWKSQGSPVSVSPVSADEGKEPASGRNTHDHP